MNNSDRVYQELIRKNMQNLEKEINKLERQNKGIRAITDRTTVEIEGLKLQLQELHRELKNNETRVELSDRKERKIDKLDTKVEKIIGKEQSHHEKIAELEHMKQSLQTKRAIRKVNKAIARQQELIKKLQKKNARIDLRQKVIMLPKYYRVKKRAKLLNKQQAKVNIAQENVRDMKELQAMLDPEHNIIDRMKSVVYDIKGTYYQKKLEHSQAVLERMKNSKLSIAIRGANVITLTKQAKNKLQNRVKQRKETAESLSQEKLAAEPGTTLSVVVR